MTATIPATQVRTSPLPTAFLERVRRDGIDDLGQPVRRLIAKGGEPCRDVLRRAQPGEELILASYTPFTKPGPFHEYGPVYVLAHPSSEAVDRDRLPRMGGDAYLREQFVIRAYSSDEDILDAQFATPATAHDIADRFLARTDVAFLHVRFPTYGCFSCRIERASSE